jgi:hypothetical protein
MKACGNCRRIWPDDYNGQCSECGAPMAGMQVNGSNDLAVRYARQRQKADREASFEQSFRSGEGHKHVAIDEPVLDAALALLKPKEGAFTDE